MIDIDIANYNQNTTDIFAMFANRAIERWADDPEKVSAMERRRKQRQEEKK